MDDAILQARPALAGLSFDTGDVRATPVDGLSWTAITIRRGKSAMLADRLAVFGLRLPDRPGACIAGAMTLLWSGADRCTLVCDGALPPDLAAAVGDAGDVTDLTGSQVTVALAGPGARRVLEKLVAVDLHPRVFGPGSAALTLLGHFGVTLWQCDAAPTYRLSSYRSFAEPLWHAVSVGGGAS